MKFANYQGRLQLVTDSGYLDASQASAGRVPPTTAAALDVWPDVLEWAESADLSASRALDIETLGPPSPQPRQIFAVGLNYAPHAEESGFEVPDYPFIFTKTQASVAPPFGDLPLPSETVDWEVEIVAIIGHEAVNVTEADAWSHVAGLTIGQDYSDREVQGRLGPNSQPTLAKSRAGFAPTGPHLVTPDEFADPDDIELATTVDGVDMQRSRTSNMVFSIPKLVAYLSAVLPLYPGDLIFTGTPEGVGFGRRPAIYLKPGQIIVTSARGLGSMRQKAVSARRPA